MKPDRRAELRRLEDASFRTTASHDNELLKDRIKALESLLSEGVVEMQEYVFDHPFDEGVDQIADWINAANAILPKTEEVKDGN